MFLVKAFCGSEKTQLLIVNKTKSTIIIRARAGDDFDWDGDHRPKNNLSETYIDAGQFNLTRQDINTSAKGNMVDLDIEFCDGNKTIGKIRFDQALSLTDSNNGLQNFADTGSLVGAAGGPILAFIGGAASLLAAYGIQQINDSGYQGKFSYQLNNYKAMCYSQGSNTLTIEIHQ